MDNKEMFEKIALIQPYIDSLIEKNYVKFLNPTADYQLIEELYYIITNRKYQKFNSSCGSCVKEALIIIINWKNRELKKMALAEVEAKEPEIKIGLPIKIGNEIKIGNASEIIETEKVVEVKKATATKKTATKIKPKTNGRK